MKKTKKLTSCPDKSAMDNDKEKPAEHPNTIGHQIHSSHKAQSCDAILLKQQLIETQQQLKASQLRIEALENTLNSLRQKLIRLAKKCISIRHYAYHDELTGLPNRSLLLDRLEQAVQQAKRRNKKVALLFIDLDKFKEINDSLGHTAGDRLLQQVAERLTSCIRSGDTACRYGGDEFIILLSDIDEQEDASAVTEKIQAHLTRPYSIEQREVKVTASIGTSLYSNSQQTLDDLIKQADFSMYSSKAKKQGSVHPMNRIIARITM